MKIEVVPPPQDAILGYYVTTQRRPISIIAPREEVVEAVADSLCGEVQFYLNAGDEMQARQVAARVQFEVTQPKPVEVVFDSRVPNLTRAND